MDILSLLVSDLNVPRSEVRFVTRLQAVYLYLHPREKTGGLAPYGPPKSVLRRLGQSLSPREEFYAARHKEGLPDWRIGQLWDAMQHRAKELAGMGKEDRLAAVRALREKERSKRGR